MRAIFHFGVKNSTYLTMSTGNDGVTQLVCAANSSSVVGDTCLSIPGTV